MPILYSAIVSANLEVHDKYWGSPGAVDFIKIVNLAIPRVVREADHKRTLSHQSFNFHYHKVDNHIYICINNDPAKVWKFLADVRKTSSDDIPTMLHEKMQYHNGVLTANYDDLDREKMLDSAKALIREQEDQGLEHMIAYENCDIEFALAADYRRRQRQKSKCCCMTM